MRVQLNPAVQLHWRRWDDEWVAFDEASGNTFQMDPLTACALLCVEGGPVDLAGLVDQVTGATDLPADALDAALPLVLERLARLGLVDVHAA